ncbi:MAG: DNA recombination protein RmuC, partial [Natronospirillum sp.]
MNVITHYLVAHPYAPVALLALSAFSSAAALALWRQWSQDRARNQVEHRQLEDELAILQGEYAQADHALNLTHGDLQAAAVARARQDETRSQLDQRLERVLAERQTLQDRLNAEQAQRQEAQKNLELVRSESQANQRHAAEKLQLLEDSEKRLQDQFENLANRIFEKKQESFSRTSQESLQALMQPMREQLKDFRQRVDQVYEKDTDDRRALRLELGYLKELNEKMNTEARALTNALKGEKKTQGNWGEMLLERILEESGLRKGHEYDTQVNVKDENGKRQQPDAVIHLPDNKDIIVDAKVSLVDFERYVNEDRELEKALNLKAHLKAVRTQMDGLARKNYEQIKALQTLDFVLMFVPIEAAFLVAMENDPLLFRDAFDRNIILVSPSTL